MNAGPSVRLLVDGHSVGWRAYHAVQGLAHQGVPTGMAFEFLQILRKVADDVRPTHIMVAWDDGVAPFRRQILPTYKLKEGEPTPEVLKRKAEFYQQREWLMETLPLFGVSWLLATSWEADDILGTWVHHLGNAYGVILSGDRDMWQLVRRNVWCYRLDGVRVKKGEKKTLITEENFQEQTGVATPRDWLYYRLLTGDGSDKIPGVPGIGEKRGLEIIRAGWPGAEAPEKYQEKLRIYEHLLNRNLRLMLLEDRLSELLRSGRRVGRSALDLAAAHKALFSMGMNDLAARWADWPEPFRRLG